MDTRTMEVIDGHPEKANKGSLRFIQLDTTKQHEWYFPQVLQVQRIRIHDDHKLELVYAAPPVDEN